MSIFDLLNKLQAEERRFLDSEVLAPVLPGRRVAVRIAGVVCHLRVDDGRFEGWAVIKPLGMDRAHIVRRASLAEVAAYLRLFPAVRLIAVVREGRRWHALPAQRGDRRVRLERPAPVLLADERVQPFDTLVARWDGQLFWHERPDARRNPALAAYLRQALGDAVPPSKLAKKGLSAEERTAYAWVWALLFEQRRDTAAGRLGDALAHAGVRLAAFVERDDSYTVTYHVGGVRHISTVRKDDLTVLTSGICLSGRDADFDLTSLVSVLHEAADRYMVRVGAGGMDEAAYRRMYPARR